MIDTIVIARHDRQWAIIHNGGFLGFADSEEQAHSIASVLCQSLSEKGRSVEIVVQDMEAQYAPPVARVGRNRH